MVSGHSEFIQLYQFTIIYMLVFILEFENSSVINFQGFLNT